MRIICSIVSLLLFTGCDFNNRTITNEKPSQDLSELNFVKDIKVPEGYKRTNANNGSFALWLRKLPLKKQRTVYLFNGLPRKNQSAQFAVLDIPVGKKDLQQCADAVMRLRAEYLFAERNFSDIVFIDNANKEYKWEGGDNRTTFEKYLETVFSWCGSASLEKQLKHVGNIKSIQSGDVFIHGGFPGHAMIVVDVAENTKGEKVFMLAQSYMPAQDIHIVKNPLNKTLNPWYEANALQDIITPEWKFAPNELRTW